MHAFLKRFVYFVGVAVLVWGTSIEAKECQEKLDFSFDDREWKEDFKHSDNIGSITEYTLKNENVNNWSELVTIQKLIPIQIPVYDYYLEFIKSLKEGVKPAEVKSHILKQSENDILFEWSIPGPDVSSQHEWFRLVKTPQSTWILRYTTKKLNEVEKQRPIWEKILGAATLKREGDCP